MPRLKDVPQYTRTTRNETMHEWRHFFVWIEHQRNDFGDNFQLDPDFQRAHVWNEEKQRKYVEYILKGGNASRTIYFNCNGWMGNWEGPMYLVDGKQRIEAVRKFMHNELKIFEGYYRKDYEDGEKLVPHAYFLVNINDLKTRKEVMQWYIDLNEGGVVHTPEELNKVRELIAKE